MTEREVSIKVPVLTRVEGEGALELDIQQNAIRQVRLRIFEPPRFFEKFLEGRHFSEVPDIVARICGICPVAYQVSAVQAFESLFEVTLDPWVQKMRRLFYCGEWIESHALHIHLLAAPDFLGYDSAPQMAKDHPELVKRGMQLQAIGNEIIRFLGGRSVHPVGIRVGGFYRAPDRDEAKKLYAKVLEAIPQAEHLLAWSSQLRFPESEQDFVSVALRHPSKYAINEGRIASSAGHNLAISAFSQHVSEQQVAHSTALHAHLDGKPYLVGPLARLNINFDRLPKAIEVATLATGLRFPSKNMYHSIVARAVEILYALQEAADCLADYQQVSQSYIEVSPKAGIAYGCSEAPRGVLWHRYELDEAGIVQKARIVPPTSQNQARMEEDLRDSITQAGLHRKDELIRFQAEQIIRNYDPCISCATHFLDLRINKS